MSKANEVSGSKGWITSYLALGIVWGASFLFIEKSLTFLTPVGVAFFRCALGALALWVVLLRRKMRINRDYLLFLQLWVMGLLLNVFPGILFAYAQEQVSSILAGIMNALTPIMSILMIMIVFRSERLSFEKVFGIILGFFGVVIVLVVGQTIGQTSASAIIALLLAVLCYGASYPFSSKYIIPRKLSPEILATTQVSLSALTLFPFFLLNGFHSYEISLEALLSILALGVLGTGIAYIWNFRNVELAGPSLASTVTYITPLVAVILGFLLLGEPLTWNEPLGGLIVLIGSAIAQGRVRVVRRR
ncbi:MAG: DMT family transporter [Actinobacteria bacterium]|uniref:DMT family transporter n=1 Tax=Candidatus Fonsibacter lacus TaxID=2576439 RepID=A0A965GBH8_9PROT|nr:DMT family transporter [Candidatus Fonsibacter lacus]